jgi:hypothetical protein
MDRGMPFNEMGELGEHLLWVSSLLGIENGADCSKVTFFMSWCLRTLTLHFTRSHMEEHS